MGGVLNCKSERFLYLSSRSGVSSTTRLAAKMASSSQPAMVATDLNLGLNMKSTFCPFSIGFFRSFGLCLGSSLNMSGAMSVGFRISEGKMRDGFLLQRQKQNRKKGKTVSNGRVFLKKNRCRFGFSNGYNFGALWKALISYERSLSLTL